MTVSPTLQKYLDQSVTYDLIPHVPTMSSTRTAEACHVPGEALAKAVVLRRDGGYMMAVLPASRHLHLSALKSQLGHKVDLASEDEIERLFEDCDRGAVPPLGECYGLDVIIDDSIDARRHCSNVPPAQISRPDTPRGSTNFLLTAWDSTLSPPALCIERALK